MSASRREERERPRMEKVRRRAGITSGAIRRYGHIPGCPGCEASGRGIRRDHNAECMKRIEGFMAQAGDSRIARYAKRVGA